MSLCFIIFFTVYHHSIQPLAVRKLVPLVTVRFDCNTGPISQEEESSNSEAEENIITDIGYNVVENDEKLGENSFGYVYDD